MSKNIDVEVLDPTKRPFIPPPAKPEGKGLEKYRLPGCGMIMFFIAIAWGIEIVDFVKSRFSESFDNLGLYPRTFEGLLGIVTMPWLHGGFLHLTSNTLSFAVLGYLVLATEREKFFSTSIKIIVLSGIGTWIIGRSSYHIGASALIYGYFGYLVTRAFMEKKVLWTVLGVALCIIYGGMIFGIMPSGKGISWEGHLMGFAAGIWLAYNNFKRVATQALVSS